MRVRPFVVRSVSLMARCTSSPTLLFTLHCVHVPPSNYLLHFYPFYFDLIHHFPSLTSRLPTSFSFPLFLPTTSSQLHLTSPHFTNLKPSTLKPFIPKFLFISSLLLYHPRNLHLFSSFLFLSLRFLPSSLFLDSSPHFHERACLSVGWSLSAAFVSK